VPSLFIVDDISSIRRLIRPLLEYKIYEICGEAEDGAEAIDSASQLKPDMILLDASIPRLGGARAASVLKPALPETRIILCTLFDEPLGKQLRAAISNLATLGTIAE
jgi:two-component system chemotaxis response regulator CheY